jgi:hypothetical protein
VDVPHPAAGEQILKLSADVPIEGRILDSKHESVAGARLFVWEITNYPPEELTRLLEGQACVVQNKGWRGYVPEQAPVLTTDADGRFRLTGIGAERVVTLVLEAPRLPRTFLDVATRLGPVSPAPKYVFLPRFEYIAPVCRRIRGMVRDKATGEAVGGVRLCAENQLQRRLHTALTDDSGCYEIFVPPQPSGWTLSAQPESGQPFFGASIDVPDRTDGNDTIVDVDLVRGILLRGRVTDSLTQTPPPSAVVEYHPLFPNPYSSAGSNVSSCVVAPDGSYHLAVLPGPGVLCAAAAPRDWYTAALVDEKELATLVKDGMNHELRSYLPLLRTSFGMNQQSTVCVSQFNALALINPQNTDSPALDLIVQRSRPVKGKVLGSDGKPLSGVTVVGLTALPDEALLEDASFTVRGLNPRGTRTLLFFHLKRELGKIVVIHGDESEILTMQLEPFGTVLGRLVDQHGKPVAGYGISLSGTDNCLFCGATTDALGRFRVSLVPGREHWLEVLMPRRILRSGKETVVVVESGQTKDLGDVRVSD